MPNRLRGIVEMLSKYFFTALNKITAHEKNISSTLYLIYNKRYEDGQSELKIPQAMQPSQAI